MSVDYRLAPEAKFPRRVDDCVAAWTWVATHARALGGDPAASPSAATAPAATSRRRPASSPRSATARTGASSCSCIRSPTSSSPVPSMLDNAVGLRPRDRPHALVLRSLRADCRRSARTGGCRRCAATSPASRPRSSSPRSTTRCATRARRTPTSSKPPASRPRGCARRRVPRLLRHARLPRTRAARVGHGRGVAPHDPPPERRRGLTCRSIRKPRRSVDAINALGRCARERRDLQEARDGLALLHASGAGRAEDVYAIGDLDADGVPVRVYRPSPDDGLPVVVYFHGGGWTIGSVDVYDTVTRALANAANAIVVSVEYRLAPEHPYPGTARRLLDRVRVGRRRTRRRSKATRAASPSPATARAATSPRCAR